MRKHKICNTTHKNDVEKSSTPFCFRPKLNAQLPTQRQSKVPIPYRDKLNALLGKPKKRNIMKQSGSSLHGKPTYDFTYLKPIVIIYKGDSVKCVLEP